MGENVSIDDFKKEAKKRAFKEKVKQKLARGKEIVINNKEAIAILTPIIIKGITTTTKAVTKNASLRKEEKNKNLYCYDPSLGHYWKLKRELTNSEWLEIDRRRSKGERYADILDDLRVLK